MAEINKVVFIVETPYNEYDHHRFGIDTLKRNGLLVEVWDVSPFILRERRDHVVVPGGIESPQSQVMQSVQEIADAIDGLDQHAMVNCFIGFSARSLPVYRSLSAKNQQYSIIKNNAVPIPIDRKTDERRSRIQRLRTISVKKLIDRTVSQALLRAYSTFGIRPASICLAGGAKSLDVRNYPMDESTEILWLHAFDYDRFLEERDRPAEIKGPYALFLDDYLPFHPDFICQKENPPCEPDTYYRLLRSLMDDIEQIYGFPVVIAAHPRSQYELLPDYFGGRRIIRGKTPGLVKGAEFVILHASTSINFAVLFRKPILFVTTDSIDKTWTGNYIRAMASEMQKVPLNLSTTTIGTDMRTDLLEDAAAYDRYRNNYIKKDGTQDRPFWDIVATYLRT